MKPYHNAITIFVLLSILLAGCGLAGQRREVINYTTYTFCKLEETPNLSIYAPWQKKTRRIKLPPNGSITIRDRGKDYILYLISCDGRYVADNYMSWPEPGEPWIVVNATDLESLHAPPPKPTRTPAVVTIKNGTGRDICSIRLGYPREPDSFGNNLLKQSMPSGHQIVLHEPEEIEYAVYVLQIQFCDGKDYETKAITFADIMTITLRGEEQDTRDLSVEREEAK